VNASLECPRARVQYLDMGIIYGAHKIILRHVCVLLIFSQNIHLLPPVRFHYIDGTLHNSMLKEVNVRVLHVFLLVPIFTLFMRKVEHSLC